MRTGTGRGQRKFRVFLNNVEQRDVLLADDIDGVVVRLARDECGELRCVNGFFSAESVSGVVRIET